MLEDLQQSILNFFVRFACALWLRTPPSFGPKVHEPQVKEKRSGHQRNVSGVAAKKGITDHKKWCFAH